MMGIIFNFNISEHIKMVLYNFSLIAVRDVLVKGLAPYFSVDSFSAL